MLTIICGSRSFSSHPRPIDLISLAIDLSGFPITFIRSGGAKGIDHAAIQYAKSKNIPYEICKPDWASRGKRAGHERNLYMATKLPQAEACIAIWDGYSSGTLDQYSIMRDLDRKVFLYTS